MLYSVGSNGEDDDGLESVLNLPPSYRTADRTNVQSGRSVDDVAYNCRGRLPFDLTSSVCCFVLASPD